MPILLSTDASAELFELHSLLDGGTPTLPRSATPSGSLNFSRCDAIVMCCKPLKFSLSVPAPYFDRWPLCRLSDCCILKRRKISSSESELVYPSYGRLRAVNEIKKIELQFQLYHSTGLAGRNEFVVCLPHEMAHARMSSISSTTTDGNSTATASTGQRRQQQWRWNTCKWYQYCSNNRSHGWVCVRHGDTLFCVASVSVFSSTVDSFLFSNGSILIARQLKCRHRRKCRTWTIARVPSEINYSYSYLFFPHWKRWNDELPSVLFVRSTHVRSHTKILLQSLSSTEEFSITTLSHVLLWYSPSWRTLLVLNGSNYLPLCRRTCLDFKMCFFFGPSKKICGFHPPTNTFGFRNRNDRLVEMLCEREASLLDDQ